MGYKYREIICGSCGHRFAFNKHSDDTAFNTYKKKDGTWGVETKCPMCGKILVSFDNETKAFPFFQRKDMDEIEVHGFRGI